MRMKGWMALGATMLLVTGAGVVGPARSGDARPNADEECVMKCDRESDECMARAGDDQEKAKACDDRYAECLKKCR